MNNMEEIIKSIVEKRKEIFQHNKFNKYIQILNTMGIPEQFDYKNCVPKVFSNIEYEKIKKFEIEPYKSLYKEIKEYAKDKKIEKNKDITIIVHPFYPIIRHANFLIQFPEYYCEYLKYEKEILKLLNNPNNNIILFETPDNFARYTYKFYDLDSVRKVVFTEHSTGIVLDMNDIKTLKQYRNFEIAGCYGKNCITNVEKQLEGIKIRRKKDLILERAIKI